MPLHLDAGASLRDDGGCKSSVRCWLWAAPTCGWLAWPAPGPSPAPQNVWQCLPFPIGVFDVAAHSHGSSPPALLRKGQIFYTGCRDALRLRVVSAQMPITLALMHDPTPPDLAALSQTAPPTSLTPCFTPACPTPEVFGEVVVVRSVPNSTIGGPSAAEVLADAYFVSQRSAVIASSAAPSPSSSCLLHVPSACAMVSIHPKTRTPHSLAGWCIYNAGATA